MGVPYSTGCSARLLILSVKHAELKSVSVADSWTYFDLLFETCSHKLKSRHFLLPSRLGVLVRVEQNKVHVQEVAAHVADVV